MQQETPKFIDIHTHQSVVADFNTVVAINNLGANDIIPPNGYYSVGLHPWYIKDKSFTELINQETILSATNVFAIGECGLDKLKGPEFNTQKDIFIQHVIASEKLKKPLIIHCVKYYNELISIKKEINPIQPWIIHGFRGKHQLAQQLQNEGFFLSFGNALFNDKRLIETLQRVNINKTFFETDNSQVDIEIIYKKASEILGVDIIELKNITFANFCNMQVK